ncbi:MAG TPA: laminin G domain-containing protein [Polyangia bacterium]|jgi:hypothetical protein|nr:laminin G domain-containing protein [Polyangia bacterium]
MIRRRAAIVSVRFAIAALIAAMGTFGTGCAQVVGFTDITAADGSIEDATGEDTASDGGFSNDTVGNDASVNDSGIDNGFVNADAGVDADRASDGSSTDSVIDGSPSDIQNGPDASSCSGGLSNVHTGDFLISFTMQTDQPDNFIGLVDQRTICVNGLFWDAWLVDQHVRLELSESTDQSRYASLVSKSAPLNDNNPHDVVITRTNGVVTIVVDGALAGSQTMDQNLGSLPPLLIGNGRCPGVVAISPAITNACVRPN